MTSSLNNIAFFASTARGLEELLKRELLSLGAKDCQIVQGGVHFKGTTKLAYYSLLWSRLASRLLLPISDFAVYSDMDLYLAVQSVDWPSIFDVTNSFLVTFTGANEEIRNTQYGAQKVKDAIVDSFMRRVKQRPMVSKQRPDIRINLFLQKNQATLALDLSGESLHQRGYRQEINAAPLKESLAAAIILRSGWQIGTPLLDPLCGSGTLLIEAALMAADMPPRLSRQYWGFTAWKQYQPELWQEILAEAKQRAQVGLANSQPLFVGYDHDKSVIKLAIENAQRAGVDQLIQFSVQELTQLTNPFHAKPDGTLLSNPPYGERLESEPALIALYNSIGRIAKQRFAGWRLSLFSASLDLLNCLPLRADKQYKAKNGALDCVQKNYLIANPIATIAKESEITKITTARNESVAIAPDFANRLRKNCKKLDQWAKQEQLECYRLYDADLPDYNVAIDRYQDKVVLQEYAAPKSIDPQKAQQRLFDLINVVLAELKLPAHHLIFKKREKQKGKKQYLKLAEKEAFFLVNEYGAKLWVNLTDYLDTGLFLDHRLARKKLGQMSKGTDFLNLFAYTGTASVYAGLGGAKSTTTVDMSRTYLEWAERNLRTNHLTGRQHRLIQTDCLSWLQETKEYYDLIFIDPPTFSNSKRMELSFDVQRDHLTLMRHLKRILRPNGAIMFSNNKRGFKMDLVGLAELKLSAQNITNKTLSLDFQRNKNIHNCWLIHHSE